MSPWDMPFCRRKLRIVSPIFIADNRATALGGWVHTNQSRTLWQGDFFTNRAISSGEHHLRQKFSPAQVFAYAALSLKPQHLGARAGRSPLADGNACFPNREETTPFTQCDTF